MNKTTNFKKLFKIKNNNNNNNSSSNTSNTKVKKITTITNLDIELVLNIKQSQLNFFGLNKDALLSLFKLNNESNISKIQNELIKFLINNSYYVKNDEENIPVIFDLFELKTSNSSINSLLYLNKANKFKVFVCCSVLRYLLIISKVLTKPPFVDCFFIRQSILSSTLILSDLAPPTHYVTAKPN